MLGTFCKVQKLQERKRDSQKNVLTVGICQAYDFHQSQETKGVIAIFEDARKEINKNILLDVTSHWHLNESWVIIGNGHWFKNST